MDKNLKSAIMARLENVAKAIKKNNMEAYVVSTKEEVVPLVKTLINKGDSIAKGGSMSLNETGVFELITNGDYDYINRDTLPAKECLAKTYTSDVFFTSCNAITDDGVLYNVDGNSNRVSAIAYGPESVIMIVGYNKIVSDLKQAEIRVKTIAAPANTVRLGLKSYCSSKGECASLVNENPQMCDGCKSDTRICCNYLISARQRQKNRIKIILVGETLGY